MIMNKKKTKRKAAAPKRGSVVWRFGSRVRRFWTNRLINILSIASLIIIVPSFLWWAEYPQRFGNFILSGAVNITAKAGFSVDEVLIKGRHYASAERILNIVSVHRGDPLFACNPEAIKKQLEEYSWVRQATVKRQLPGILFIDIQERQPVALWQHRQRHFLVDEQGVIISSDRLHEFSKLPTIVGGDAPVHAPHILGLLENFPNVRQKMTALVRIGGRRWDLQLNKTVQIKLPEANIEEALVRLSMLMQQKKFNPAEITVIDLRIPNQMVMKLLPTAAVRVKGKGKET
jgi:cell division protein FtsQ